MYNYTIGAHPHNKSNTIFYKQFPVFACFFAFLVTLSLILYFLDLVTVTMLLWLAIASLSIFVLVLDSQWAVYMLIIAVPFYNIQILYSFGPSIIQHIIMKPINLVTFLVLCVFFIKKLTHNNQKIKVAFPAYHLPVVALCIWGIISESWTPIPVFGMDMGIALITNMVIYFLISYYANSMEAIRKIMLCWISMGIFVAICMLISIIPGDKHTETIDIGNQFSMTSFFEFGKMRAEGIADEKGGAIFVYVAVLFAAGLATTTQKTRNKLFVFLSIAFLTFVFFFSQAKGPLLGLIIGVLFATPFLINMRKSLIRYVCYIGISFFVIFGIFFKIVSYLLQFTKEKGNVASRFVSSSAASEALSCRFEYWEKIYKQLIHNDAYITGFGIGGSTYYLYPPVPHPHNIYISIIGDFGFIGFVVIIAIALFISGDVFYCIKKLPAGSTQTLIMCIYAAIIAVGISSISDYSYAFTIPWALLGLIAAAHKQIRNYTLFHEQRVR